ncbi:hypothetical protein D9M70_427950 [compost metagenome]
MYTVGFFSLSLLSSLLVGVVLQLSFELPKYAFARYAVFTWISVMLVNLMAFTLIKDAAALIDRLQVEELKLLTLYLIPLGACILAAVCSTGSFGGLKFAAPISLFFALIIAFYSGVLAGLPEHVMQRLGLGNYKASRVLLEPAYCDATLSRELELNADCQLTNVHVVWSLGETYTFTLDQHALKKQLHIPARFIKAVVRDMK